MVRRAVLADVCDIWRCIETVGHEDKVQKMTAAIEKKLLILDLDETLVHARERPLSIPCDFETKSYKVYKRPGLGAFLSFCREHFRVAVWTSAGETYANEVESHLFPEDYPLEFVWSAQRCTRRYDPVMMETYWLKNLAKVKRRGYRLERVLMVDDTPRKLEENYGNLVPILPWEGEQGDDQLEKLAVYLEHLSDAPNVRVLEKREWWSKTSLFPKR